MSITKFHSYSAAINYFAENAEKKLNAAKNGQPVSFAWEDSFARHHASVLSRDCSRFKIGLGLGVKFTAVVLWYNKSRYLLTIPLFLAGAVITLFGVDMYKISKNYDKLEGLLQQFLNLVKNPKQITDTSFDVTKVKALNSDSIGLYMIPWLNKNVKTGFERAIIDTALFQTSREVWKPLTFLKRIYANADCQSLWEKMEFALHAVYDQKAEENMKLPEINALAIAIGKVGSQLSPDHLQKLNDERVTFLATRYKDAGTPFNPDGSGLSIMDEKVCCCACHILMAGEKVLKAAKYQI